MSRDAPPSLEQAYSGLYAALLAAEEAEARCTYPHPGNAVRLAALRAGEPVDIYAGDLPPEARVGVTVRWWTRAVVRPDGTVALRDDDGSLWLEENGL
jgi:hypothetical protein